MINRYFLLLLFAGITKSTSEEIIEELPPKNEVKNVEIIHDNPPRIIPINSSFVSVDYGNSVMVKNFSQINKIELRATKTPQSNNFWFLSGTAHRDENSRYRNSRNQIQYKQLVLNQILTEGNILAAMDPCQVYDLKLNFHSDDEKQPTSYSFEYEPYDTVGAH